MRVHELAKQLGITSKDLLARLHDLGIEAKTHMSTVEDAAIELLTEESSPAPAKEKTPPVPPAPEPAAPEEETAGEPPVPSEDADAEVAPGPKNVISIRGAVIVKDFADQLGMLPNRLIAELMSHNILASINERIDVGVARQIAEKHGFVLEHQRRAAEHAAVHKKREELDLQEEEDRPESMAPRPPVVTFLGHVDHGKTSLLDRIRNTAVVDDEFGGITQHIGASTVSMSGRTITFLDTPGHEAFTAMRARGANLTDIAVIVIAVDDGIMPQTREAIMHAQAAGVSLIVAINKIDLPSANVDRTKQQLQQMQMAPEDWGGEIICCPVSAETGEGIDHLLEMILLQADVLDLQANPTRRASGYVIEASLQPGMGPTANLLVTRGTLKLGDSLFCDQYAGKVRALINDHGVKVKSAGPSTPVRCLGLSGVPEAGAAFRVCPNDRMARTLAQNEERRLKSEQTVAPRKASLDAIYDQIEQSRKIELNLILKTDTQGSLEAILHAFREIPDDKVALNMILNATGNITESDVLLASASSAVVLGFHVAKESGVDASAKHEGVEIQLHSVIYELIERVRDAMVGLLPAHVEERVMGRARVQQVFVIGKQGTVAGCMCDEGALGRSQRVRVKRGDEVLFEGNVASLKHFQDDVPEIRQSQECGIRLNGYGDYEPGDILEFYELAESPQAL